MKTMKSRIILLVIIVIMLLSLTLVACNGINGKSIDKKYEYNKVSYTMNGGQTWVWVNIVDWKVDESGALEITTTQGEKRLIYCQSWILTKE